jgi:hypothetical protein
LKNRAVVKAGRRWEEKSDWNRIAAAIAEKTVMA